MNRQISSLCLKRLPEASILQSARRRCLATVSSSLIVQPPPPPPPPVEFPVERSRELPESVPPLLDHRILQATSKPGRTTLTKIIKEYVNTSGKVLDLALPYESRPSEARRPDFTNEIDSCKNVVTVAHCAQVGTEHKITLSSGFALNIDDRKAVAKGETLIVTCAHTLEEIRQSPLLVTPVHGTTKKYTGSFIVTGTGAALEVYPVSHVLSALPRSDLILLSCPLPPNAMNSLPLSPYPAHKDTPIRAHFVAQEKPDDTGWMPWIGGTWGKWHHGKVLGYRDFAGRETEPGTYDALSHLLFTPLPTAGSSGGPIVDEESGAVIGVMLGTRMDNRVEGVRGWGVPAESVFEMFSLPGLEGKK